MSIDPSTKRRAAARQKLQEAAMPVSRTKGYTASTGGGSPRRNEGRALSRKLA